MQMLKICNNKTNPKVNENIQENKSCGGVISSLLSLIRDLKFEP